MNQPRILSLVMRPCAPGQTQWEGRVELADLYDLGQIDLGKYRGINLTVGCDQIFLAKQREKIEAWVVQGGRLLINGHPVNPFLANMPSWRKLHFHGVDDIWLHALGEHPIWRGIERRDFLLRTGVPGEHSFEELLRIGVGGFYARNYLADLPDACQVITGLGPGRLPVDVSYPLGRGEIIMHCGNDLLSFDKSGPGSTNFGQQILDYLQGDLGQDLSQDFSQDSEGK